MESTPPASARDLEVTARLSAQARQLAVLNRVARLATAGLELRPMLQGITDLLHAEFGWEFVACVSIDHEKGRFVCEAVTSAAPTEIHAGYGRPLGSGVVGEVAATGKTILLDDVRTSANYVETYPGVKSELCVPVTFGGEVLALFNLESTRLAAFRDEAPLLSTVAEQVAGAIRLVALNEKLRDGNRLLSEANDRLLRSNAELAQANARLVAAEARVEAAEEKLAGLLQATPTAPRDLRAWSKAIAEEIARTLGAIEVGLWEVDQGNLLRLTDDSSESPSADSVRRMASGERFFLDGEETLVAVEGTSGELRGVLVIRAPKKLLEASERRLVGALARQLGGALELARIRRQLAAAEVRKAATRAEMRAKGLATLQVCPFCGACYDDGATTCPQDGGLLDDSRLLPYRLADRYRFVTLIGQGGMGTVFLAHDERLVRDVALKLIRPEHFGKPDVKTRFEREARTLAKIQHPGVVALFDSGELEDGSLYLVMERLVGRDLGSVLAESGAGTPRQVARLLRQAGAALGAAHRAGIVHRDVKPENLYLVPDAGGFTVKVFDFGLAKSLAVDPGLTQFGMIVGTPAYMSPEQARGEDVTAASDLYSLAAVAYEALTGRRAVAGSDVGRILSNVLDAVPLPVSDYRPRIPPEVDAAFQSALAKDAARRPPGVESWIGSFVDRLERVPPDVAGWPEALRPDPVRTKSALPTEPIGGAAP